MVGGGREGEEEGKEVGGGAVGGMVRFVLDTSSSRDEN